MNETPVNVYNACPACQHRGRLLHTLWPAACAQCGETLMYSNRNPWVFFLKTWGALPFIFVLVERKLPVWQGALMGVGVYLLVNACLWFICVGCGRPYWFVGRLQRYSRTGSVALSQVNWKRFVMLLLLISASLFSLYLLMRLGLSYSPIGR